MSVRRTLAIARKEFHHITRDLRIFFLVTISPAFLLLTLSYVFAFDVEHVTLGVMDLDKSPLSRQYVSALTGDGELEVRIYADDYGVFDAPLLRGEIEAALVIPPDFSQRLLGGRSTSVQAIVDGADSIVGGQTLGNLGARTKAFAASLRPANAERPAPQLDMESRAWYNANLESLLGMVPGLMAIVLCMPALAIALALTREKEVGTLEGLIASPILGPEYLVGKLAPYVLSGLVSVGLAWLVAVSWFRVPFRGNILVFLLLSCDYLVASMALGILVATFVSSQQTAMFIVLMIFFVPSFFLSGLTFPVNTESLGSQLVAYSLPSTHFITIARAVFLKGLGLTELGPPALSLAGIAIAALILSVLLTKKKIA